ncbi:MAG: phosphate ABC transporter permease subunit PstC [Caloramator sp.]|nr:phosphate ABC transporter permease subunit PstC [Caloramator sp.]
MIKGKNIFEVIFSFAVKMLTLISISLLFLIIIFIFKESIPFFKKVPVELFLKGNMWRPLSSKPQFSLLPMILSTLYISFLSVLIALPVGLFCAVFLSFVVDKKVRKIIKPMIDMLVGIPSVIYGFIGLLIIVKFFEDKFSMATGETVLAGALLLSIMILPFVISTIDESIRKNMDRYYVASKAMGVSKWYFVWNVIIKASKRGILAGVIMALGRALGETMAVMMVTGNSPIMPRLLGKAETISSLIALEMGTVQVGSLHYHALFAAGFILMIMILFINVILNIIKKALI